MKPFLTLKVFPHCLRLPRFLKIREQFSGKDLNSRNVLLDSICNELAAKEHTSPKRIQSWILTSFYLNFTTIMKLQRGQRPGLNSLLSDLKKAGVYLAVLSDYDFVTPRLRNLNIDDTLFDITASCEAAGALKPSPRPFIEISDKWKIAPENTLIIGDRDDTDGEAARRAGMKFIRISDKATYTESAYSWVQIRELLRSITFRG